MNILITNNYLNSIGGTEMYTYYLIKNLLKYHNVEYFTLNKGVISNLIERDLKINFMSKPNYDLILANHNTTVDQLINKGPIIQTCHGVLHGLEQPSKNCKKFVAISDEVQKHLKTTKNIDSKIIVNGIDCEVYTNINPINYKLKKILSLCQSEKANIFLKQCCDKLDITVSSFNKYQNSIFKIYEEINKNDLVIGYGRSIYDAMACGRPCIIFDHRDYQKNIGDGYVTIENFSNFIKNNCSGRYSKIIFNENIMIENIKKYSQQDGKQLQKFANEKLNIENNIIEYIKYHLYDV